VRPEPLVPATETGGKPQKLNQAENIRPSRRRAGWREGFLIKRKNACAPGQKKFKKGIAFIFGFDNLSAPSPERSKGQHCLQTDN
jgi:hypothetical protein